MVDRQVGQDFDPVLGWPDDLPVVVGRAVHEALTSKVPEAERAALLRTLSQIGGWRGEIAPRKLSFLRAG